MHSAYHDDLGFTIVELILALVIIGVMSVIAGSKFFSATDYNRRVYYDEILNSIRYARKLAVATNSHIQVNLTSSSLTLLTRTEGASCAAATFYPTAPNVAIIDPATRTTGYVKTAPGQVTLNFSAANWPIYFNGLGQALLASNCSVLSSASTVQIVNGNTITVTGETGLTQ